MNEVLKQRLVGALILVALGVVFWPIIFVEPGEQGGAEEARIPPRPRVDTTPVEPPDMAGLRTSHALEKETAPDKQLLSPAPDTPPATSSKVAEKAPQAADKKAAAVEKKAPIPEKKTRSEPPVKPVIDADGIPVMWILRVASVSSSGRADELRKRLLDMGHKAYTKKIKSGGKTLYRVYVGPKAEKARLEKIQGQVNSEFGVTTMVTRYYP